MKQPTINTARKITEEHKARGTIILCFDDKRFLAASHGATKSECKSMGKLLDAIADQIESGELVVW